jgi:enoyl-CoA hydratase
MIDYEARGRIALITIDRAHTSNTIDPGTAAGIEAALDRFEANPDLWAGILTGRGKVFSVGADLHSVMAGQGPELLTDRGGFGGLVRRRRVKPLIAAVEGPALAGGCELAMACDLVVASQESVFGLPDVKRSMIAASGGLFRLPRIVGTKVALEMILTGEPVDASRALELGLINRVVEPGTVLDAAIELAERIVSNAPIAVWESRRVAMAAIEAYDDFLWEETARAAIRVTTSDDFAEGPRSWVEGRKPYWEGR